MTKRRASRCSITTKLLGYIGLSFNIYSIIIQQTLSHTKLFLEEYLCYFIRYSTTVHLYKKPPFRRRHDQETLNQESFSASVPTTISVRVSSKFLLYLHSVGINSLNLLLLTRFRVDVDTIPLSI